MKKLANLLLGLFRKHQKPASLLWDKQFTGPAPRYSGAITAVTTGPPEDINEMPATENPDVEGPIYDGSQFRRSAHV